jgi:RimJ/RimL family protein N-acetyltransferase
LAKSPDHWESVSPPNIDVLIGRYVELHRLDAQKHAAQLFKCYVDQDQVWTYLPYGPFHSSAQYHRWIEEMSDKSDPYFFAIKDKQSQEFRGVASFLRIDPNMGTIEVGHLNFSPSLQKTPAATEAMFLMMQWAFDAGYRRYEWKCDAANIPSRRAAQRLGLSFEGIFRQAAIVKKRNRDTAWYAAIDTEWPALKEAFLTWLHPSNFTPDLQQKETLGNLTRLILVQSDPAAASNR